MSIFHHEPDRETREGVRRMIACGLSRKEIAKVMCITVTQLKELYDVELSDGESVINMKVANVLLDKALKGDSDLLKFWLKSRAGWKEVQHVEVNSRPVVTLRDLTGQASVEALDDAIEGELLQKVTHDGGDSVTNGNTQDQGEHDTI